MKKELRVALIFWLVQLLLSIAVWGNFEYSILSGDMVQTTEASFWTFVLGDRLIYYIAFSIVNLILFALLSIRFSCIFHPGLAGAVILAIGTVALAVPLSLNSAFRVPYPLVAAVAFLAASIVYGVISRAMENRSRGKNNRS